jgi:hypothetical protein
LDATFVVLQMLDVAALGECMKHPLFQSGYVQFRKDPRSVP